MLRSVAELARNFTRLVYPEACLVCDARADDRALAHGLCPACRIAITTDPRAVCPWCAHSVGPYSDTAQGCMECRSVALGFERAFRLGPYTGALREAVLRMKNRSGEGLADLMGRTFVEVRGTDLANYRIGVVCPVPLHWRRRWRRGYNQAEAVAREIAAGLKVVFEPHLLQRIKTDVQHAQPSRADRMESIKGAFRVKTGARLTGLTVLVVDDVMTTGSTLGEAARVLFAAGAERVIAAVLARKDGA